MPIHVTRTQIPLSQVDALVQAEHTPKTTFWSPRAGSISVAAAEPAGKYLFRIVCPGDYSERAIRRAYQECVRLAKKFGILSLAIPLLLPENREDLQKEALHLAIRTLQDALDDHSLQVHLTVPSPALHMPAQQRQQLTDYIAGRKKEPRTRIKESYGIECGKSVLAEPMPPSPSMAPSAARKMAPSSAKKLILQPDAGFSETLLKLIDKTGKKDSEIYNKANVSRQHFSKIRNNPNYNPTKATAIAFAIALELDMEQTRDLIGRAGYALTRSSIFDLIIMYFIENKNYDLYDINEALFEFDQNLLGA